MTLARKMMTSTAALIVGLLLLAAASLWGLAGVNRNLGRALSEYETLRRVYEIGLDVSHAREMLTTASPDELGAADRLRAAILKLDAVPPGPDAAPAAAAATALRAILPDIDRLPADSTPESPATLQLVARLNSLLNGLARLSQQTKREILAIDQERRRQMRLTMTAMGLLSAVIIAAAVVVGVAQYRGVIRPLRRLAQGVAQIAAGRFTQRLPTDGNDELARLSEDFNRMAVELDELYRQWEQKVDAKSRELIRSERLASVGFLAAGVAHEINNPLSIIAGHAELSLRDLERSDTPAARQEAQKVLRIIADEAFRCKKITEKLLSLLRGGGSEGRAAVSVPAAAREVLALTGGLPRYRQRAVTLRCDPDEDLRVLANVVELKQVLLNLVVNALEAVEPGAGRVEIAARRQGAAVEISVSDNGRGMTPQTLERVFEPFFTHKRGLAQSQEEEAASGAPGTGLGLSITHAIVEGHGGRIRAESAGPGKGSRFIMDWPAAGQAGLVT